MELTDLQEVKRLLDIDPNDNSENLKLSFFIDYTFEIIEECLNRRPIQKKLRTEYPRSSGTQRIKLKARPVVNDATLQVWVDELGYWGQSSNAFASTSQLTQGNTDNGFALDIDRDDGNSDSGILYRIGFNWPRPLLRQAGLLTAYVGDPTGSIKVQYTGGFSIDTLPSPIRMAANLLTSRLALMFPTGMEIQAATFQEFQNSFSTERKGWLMSAAKPLLFDYINWYF